MGIQQHHGRTVSYTGLGGGANMGMMTNRVRAGGTYATGTSSFPVTGFPASAYLGNNRRVGGGSNQSQPSPMAGGLGSALQYNPQHSLIILIVLIALGYFLWHLDNR